MKKKILIIGGDSYIGNYLSKAFAKKYHVHKTSRRNILKKTIYLDLVNIKKKDFAFNKIKNVSVAIFCAGITKNKVCEGKKLISKKINVHNTINFIDQLLKKKIRVIFISSDSVFSDNTFFNKADSKTNPRNLYGLHKFLVEMRFKNKKNISILRLSKVFDIGCDLYLLWKNIIKNKRNLRLYENYYIWPIRLSKVSKAIDQIIKKKNNGIYHLRGDRRFSYYSLAKKYFPSYKRIFLIKKKNEIYHRPKLQISKIFNKI